MNVKKIAVFKPINARHDNAFGTGEYEVFKSINELEEYEVTFFLSDKNIYFTGVNNEYIKENNLQNNIFLRGFLEHKKLLNSFCDYDLFI